MTSRTTRLSVGAGGLVVGWIIVFWWMDSDPTIRFDVDNSSDTGRFVSPAPASQRVTIEPPITNAQTLPLANGSASVLPPLGGSNDTAPEAGSAPQPDAAPVEMRLYTIQPGDLLSRIAQREYGSIRYTDFLYEHNRERLDLASPDAIREGQVLEIPPRSDAQGAGGGNG